jgi:hypothetical protein
MKRHISKVLILLFILAFSSCEIAMDDSSKESSQETLTKGKRALSSNTALDISIQAEANGKYVSLSGIDLVSNATNVGTNQTMKLVPLSNGFYGIMGPNGKYASSDLNFDGVLKVNRDAPLGWEEFSLIHLGDDKYNIKANSNGKYVSAEDAGNGNLVADRDEAKGWEIFTIKAINIIEEPPVTPSNFSGDAKNQSVSLNWDGSLGATSYTIYWGQTIDFEISDDKKIESSDVSVNHTGLVNGENYFYKIVAGNSFGVSESSGIIGPYVPEQGARVQLTVSFKRTEDWGNGYVGDFTITNIGSEIADEWELTFDSAIITSDWGANFSQSGNKVTVTGQPISAGNSLSGIGFVVNDSNDPGNIKISGGEPVPPLMPTNFIGTPSNNLVSLTWNSSDDATSYNIYWGDTNTVSKDNGTLISVSTNSFAHENLVNDKDYYYILCAVNEAGISPFTPVISAKPDLLPPPPVAYVSAELDNGSALVTWPESNGAQWYVAYYRTVGTNDITEITEARSPLRINDISNPKEYDIWIHAGNSAGMSEARMAPKSNGLEGILNYNSGTYTINGITVVAGNGIDLAPFTNKLVYAVIDTGLGYNLVTRLSENTDYRTALTKSVQFFDANKSGPEAGDNNIFSWRGAAHVNDGSDVGLDLTGGYFDAGDHIKFGLPGAYSAGLMGWAYYENRDAFIASNSQDKMEQQLRYFGDYLLKLHPTSTTFVWQVAEGANDFGTGSNSHGYMHSPENDPTARPTMIFDLNASSGNPGMTNPLNDSSRGYLLNSAAAVSDVASQSAAALALMYLNFTDSDYSYANSCLSTARSMYSLAKAKLGNYPLNASYGVDKYYGSNSFYDDLAWAAVWLYEATGEQRFLTEAENFISQTSFGSNQWTMDWANSHLGAVLKLAQITDKSVYKDAMEFNLNWWVNGDLSASGGKSSPTNGGLHYLNDWASLRYVSSAVNLALQYYKINQDDRYLDFAKSQVDYILGNNPRNMSYLIGFTGFGSRFPSSPHHRGANPGLQGAAEHELTGALVGGPDQQDNFSDDPGSYEYTEVALDYNASFVSAMSGIILNFTSME